MDRLANEQQASINRLTEALESRNRRGTAARIVGGLLLLAAVTFVWFQSTGSSSDSATLFAGFVAALLGTLLLARG